MDAPVLAHLGVLLATAVVVVSVVVVHFEGMIVLGRLYLRYREREGQSGVGRHRMVGLICGLVLLHFMSIVVFGMGIWVVLQFPGTGSISGGHAASLFDSFYLSAMTYSTVGFGDLTPKGPIRWLAGTEALVGLMMVAWSASFAFREMSLHWNEEGR